jgi:DNA topoisomerase-1
MSKTLVIVESPGKIAKIGQFLGPSYIVKASFGHVMDLDKETLSIDVENNFKPLYKVTTDKTKVVKELKALAKDCSDVLLAADGDREGEAIASSLATVLGLKNPKRIIFNEITKTALTKAVMNPITINDNMVNAQQTRRLLDRLVGYKISPVLWKFLVSNKSGQSAGRVQSVVVRIINDMENKINESISSPYFKTTADFIFNDMKLHSTLYNGKKIYQFANIESSKEFLNNIKNNKPQFKVQNVENKKAIRKPSAPFITSSLQQEASTKLHFNVKKTMDVAQKLYEAGHITYMRSDSPNMSKEAINEAKKYIEEKWGKEYSNPKNFESKNASSQDAHECIRPTHMEISEPDNISNDMMRLYSLIWKRTIASQMSDANVNVQTIQIDATTNSKPIVSYLVLDNIQCYFISTLENVEFPGYLIVYDNTIVDENSEENSKEPALGKLEIKIKDKLVLEHIKVIEEYTKPPLRYNEAALVRYLEKNGIGRPSTYASIISKVIERNYVEIRNVDGVKKDSRILELNNMLKLKESTKEVFIGKETKKLVPTSLGIEVTDFMMKHFGPIMDIEFTANFETYLDKIAEGNANWVTILRTFYDMFNPIVEKLNNEAKEKKKEIGSSTDKLLGENDGNMIYVGSGKYGPYVKIIEDNKPRFAQLKDISIDDVTLEQAIIILEYPKTIGKIGNAIVTLNKGPYGFYFKCNGKNYSIKDNNDINSLDITYAKNIIESGDIYALKTFKVKDKIMNIKNGEFGNYIQIVSGTKKQNISIPNKIPSSGKIEDITLEEVLKIIADKNGIKKK